MILRNTHTYTYTHTRGTRHYTVIFCSTYNCKYYWDTCFIYLCGTRLGFLGHLRLNLRLRCRIQHPDECFHFSQRWEGLPGSKRRPWSARGMRVHCQLGGLLQQVAMRSPIEAWVCTSMTARRWRGVPINGAFLLHFTGGSTLT
jgi:hypothetical protein